MPEIYYNSRTSVFASFVPFKLWKTSVYVFPGMTVGKCEERLRAALKKQKENLVLGYCPDTVKPVPLGHWSHGESGHFVSDLHFLQCEM